MSNTNWIFAISPKVFTTIKNEFSSEIKERYSMSGENFSTEIEKNTPTKFPFVNVLNIALPEIGNDLENSDINAVIAGFQIDVYDNESVNKAKVVMQEIVRIMKSMRFNTVFIPVQTKDGSLHKVSMRFERIIAFNDVL